MIHAQFITIDLLHMTNPHWTTKRDIYAVAKLILLYKLAVVISVFRFMWFSQFVQWIVLTGKDYIASDHMPKYMGRRLEMDHSDTLAILGHIELHNV